MSEDDVGKGGGMKCPVCEKRGLSRLHGRLFICRWCIRQFRQIDIDGEMVNVTPTMYARQMSPWKVP